MQKLHIMQSELTPEVYFSPAENLFFIRGTSSPEDVRDLYHPVIEWLKAFIDDAIKGDRKVLSTKSPLKFQIDLSYFNSSSAKFLFDILMELKRLTSAGIPLNTEWHFDEEDTDMKEAGADIAELAGMELTLVANPAGDQ